MNVSDRSRDGETVLEDSYTEHVDLALAELATVTNHRTREFGELVVRRPLEQRPGQQDHATF